MATIASARLVRATTLKKPARPQESLRDIFTRFVYGRSAVSCEECELSLSPSKAIWRGAHPYCSIGHEAADSF
jgi:hypothetical protein